MTDSANNSGQPSAIMALSAVVERVTAIDGWQWILTTSTLLFAFPWIALFGTIATPPELPLDAFVVILAVFEGVSALMRPVILKTGLNGRKTTRLVRLVCVIVFAASFVAYHVLSNTPEAGGLASLPAAAALLACVAVMALCYSLFSQWWMSDPISKMPPSSAAVIVPMFSAAGCVLYLFLGLMTYPAGGYIAIALYFAVFVIAALKTPLEFVAPTSFVSSISHGDTFAMQKRLPPTVVVLIAFFLLGFCMCLCAGERVTTMYPFTVVWGALTVPVIALTVIVAFVVGRRKSALLTLLLVSVCIAVSGCMIFGVAQWRDAGMILVVGGCVLVNAFSMLLYNSVCQQKGYSSERSDQIFSHSSANIPIGVFAGIAAWWLQNLFLADATDAVIAVTAIALVVAFCVLVYSELSKTRSELQSKSNATVALDDIQLFARTQGAAYKLTARECEIIQLSMSGRSVAAMARELFLSESTVKSHVRSIYKKLDVHSRQEMIDLLRDKL